MNKFMDVICIALVDTYYYFYKKGYVTV